MKLNCGPTYAERVAAKERWHLWFAWRPVRVEGGGCRWMEKVWRKGRRLFGWDGYYVWEWTYYPIEAADLVGYYTVWTGNKEGVIRIDVEDNALLNGDLMVTR